MFLFSVQMSAQSKTIWLPFSRTRWENYTQFQTVYQVFLNEINMIDLCGLLKRKHDTLGQILEKA